MKEEDMAKQAVINSVQRALCKGAGLYWETGEKIMAYDYGSKTAIVLQKRFDSSRRTIYSVVTVLLGAKIPQGSKLGTL